MFEADSSSSLISSSSSSSNGVRPTSSPQTKSQLPVSALTQETKIKSNSGEPETVTTNEDEGRPEQSNTLSSTGTPSSTTKAKPAKVCGVCGDHAKSFHFGGLSCDSCKAFFRRSVHNDTYLGFQCAYQAGCEVTKDSRKSCQACRFGKCLGIGMEKKWVMTDQEKTQLKLRKEKKEAPEEAGSAPTPKPNSSAPPDYEPDVCRMLEFMSREERDEIECIVNKYQHSYREIPFRVSQVEGSRSTVEIIQMFTTILRRFAYFTKLLPEFTEMSIGDQSTLLRGSVLEMCLLRGALSFDFKSNRWPKTENMEFLKDCPKLRVEDMEKLVSKDLYEMHMQFINGIQELGADEATVMILLLIVLFYPERAAMLEASDYVGQVQEKYLLLLNKYVQWRYGPKGTKTFPKLLTKLADLRQLNDSHTEYNLKMTKNEVERIQEQLGNINLNPYPQWVLVEDQLEPTQGEPRTYAHPTDYHQEMEEQETGMPSFQDLYQQNLAQEPVQAPAPPLPTARDFFMQFVNRKIPVLINNPFAPFPIENELASARSFFESMGGGGMMGTGDPTPSPFPSAAQTGPDPMSQFKEILESSDPNMLRQLKDTMSPSLLSKLQSVFGNGGGPSGGGAAPFDLSKIPPELLSGFMGGGRGRTGQEVGPDFSQLAAQYGGQGFPPPAPGTYLPNYDQWQAEVHPLAHQSGPQMTQHFHELQQQLSTPPSATEAEDQHQAHYDPAQLGYQFEQIDDQQQGYFPQQQQPYLDQYNNWTN